jgi:hypothetical protein
MGTYPIDYNLKTIKESFNNNRLRSINYRFTPFYTKIKLVLDESVPAKSPIIYPGTGLKK